MKKLCLIRPTHKTDHPMGTESAGSIDTLSPIIILLRQGETNGKRNRTETTEKREIKLLASGFPAARVRARALQM